MEGPRTVLEVHGFTRAVVGILAVVAICHQAEGGNVSTHRFLSSSPASTVVLLVDGDSGSPLTTHNGQCGLSASTACATVRAAAAMAARPEYANAHIKIQIAAGRYGADSCNAVFNQPVSLTGAGSATTKIDCGFTSRFLHVNGTQSSLMVSGLSVYNCTSYYNAMEHGGVVDGGAVLVTWQGAVSGLSATFDDVHMVRAWAIFNSTVGHQGIHVIGGAIGIQIPSYGCEGISLTVMNSVFEENLAAGGESHSCFVVELLPCYSNCLCVAVAVVTGYDVLPPVEPPGCLSCVVFCILCRWSVVRFRPCACSCWRRISEPSFVCVRSTSAYFSAVMLLRAATSVHSSLTPSHLSPW